MKKQLLSMLLVAAAGCSVYGQGFSKNIKYNQDGIERKEFINAMTYDSSSNALFFALNASIPQVTSYLYKTDVDGNVSSIFADTGNAEIYYGDVINSQDGTSLYWTASGTRSYSIDSSFWKVVKTDKNLNIIWQKTYNFYSYDAMVTAIKEVNNGTDLVVLGYNYTLPNGLSIPQAAPKIDLLKIDSSGNTLSFHETGADNSYGFGLVCNDSNQYMIVGVYDSLGDATNRKSFLWKIDTTGNILWQHALYNSPLTSSANSIIKDKAHAGRYICVSQVIDMTNFYAAGRIKNIDDNGNEIWDKMHYPTGLRSNVSAFTSVINTNDDGMITAGFVNRYDTSGLNDMGTYGWLVKMNQDGDTIWQKPYSFVAPDDNFTESLSKIVALPDGSFIAAGVTFGIVSQSPIGTSRTQDGWLLKVDSNGCFNTTCIGVAPQPVSVNDVNVLKDVVKVFPNPANDQLTFTSESNEQVQLFIDDIAGRNMQTLVLSKQHETKVLNVSNWVNGIYLIRIQLGNQAYYQKIVVQH